ncbi:MAG: hypothetical protein U0519_00490 [Candidatus Gracilibacteria bacterium]
MEPACQISKPGSGNHYGKCRGRRRTEDGVLGPTTPGPNNTVKLRVSSNKNALKTGAADTMNITIEGLSAGNVLQSGDSQTLVDLTIQKPDGKEVAVPISTHPAQLHNGMAVIQLQSTNEMGVFTVKAYSTNKAGLPSNTITITSTKNHIRLLSYTTINGLTYGKLAGSGFIVQDADGKTIAEVNGLTGMLTIKDDKYQLATLPSKGSKPARLGVQEKSSGTVVASVFFVVDKTKPVVVDSSSVDYFSTYASLEGTHVQDLNSTDTYTVETLAADHASNQMALTFTANQPSKRRSASLIPSAIFLLIRLTDSRSDHLKILEARLFSRLLMLPEKNCLIFILPPNIPRSRFFLLKVNLLISMLLLIKIWKRPVWQLLVEALVHCGIQMTLR